MPFASLNRFDIGRPLAWNDAWQQWIGLPEGASFRFWLKSLAILPNPFRFIDVANISSIGTTVSPCAGRTGGLMQHSKPRRQRVRGVRTIGRWSASCRSAVTGQRALRNQFASITVFQTIGIPAGCFCSGVTKNNIPQVGGN